MKETTDGEDDSDVFMVVYWAGSLDMTLFSSVYYYSQVLDILVNSVLHLRP